MTEPKKNIKRAGRKRIVFDWKRIDELLMVGCPGTEVAAVVGCYSETLYAAVRREFNMDFSEYLQKKRSKGDALWREKLFSEAMNGNTAVLIFGAKTRLDMIESVKTIHEMSSKGMSEETKLKIEQLMFGKKQDEQETDKSQNQIAD